MTEGAILSSVASQEGEARPIMSPDCRRGGSMGNLLYALCVVEFCAIARMPPGSEILLHQPVNPLGSFGILFIINREIWLYVQNRRAVDGVKALNS